MIYYFISVPLCGSLSICVHTIADNAPLQLSCNPVHSGAL